jgi:hypothetical protein
MKLQVLELQEQFEAVEVVAALTVFKFCNTFKILLIFSDIEIGIM